jgi:hypothetical protein
MKSNKPYTKWSKEDVVKRLKKITEQDGDFPTRKRLDQLKESRLTNAINHLKLTYYDLALELGFTPKQRPRGYWTEENVLKEIQMISDRIGELPSPVYIKDNRPDLLRAIYRTRDWRYYKSKLGYSVKEKWDHEKIIDRFEKIVELLGRTPTTGDLKKHDYNLLGAIDHSSQSLRDLTIELGYSPSQRAKGFWKIWENVEDIIRPHCKKNTMPPVAVLKKELGSSIGLAVADFGGVVDVAERMGLKVSPESYLTAKDGHALKSSYEVEFDDFLYEQGIDHEVDCEIVPDRKIRCDFKIGDTFIEIWGFEERTNNKRCERYGKKRVAKERVYRERELRLFSIEGSLFRKSKKARRTFFKQLIARINQKYLEKELEVAYRHIVPLFGCSGNNCGIIGSGTVIEIDDLTFIATAKHVVQELQRYEEVRSGKLHTGIENLFILNITQFGVHPTADVGYLQVSNKFTSYCLNCNFLEWDDLTDKLTNQRPHFALCGYPKIQQETIFKSAEFVAMRLGKTGLITSLKDHKSEAVYGEFLGKALYLNYNDDELNSLCCWQGKFQNDKQPYGFSGCGVWMFMEKPLNENGNELWTPCNMKLVGIQSCWNERGDRYLVAAGINDWLDLIQLDYPELAI